MPIDKTPHPPELNESDSTAGVKRPDQGGGGRPADTHAEPASGGDGARGAGS